MLLQSSQTKVYVAAKPTDMRKSFHGLLMEVQAFIAPQEIYEALFLFFSKNKDRVKILHYDKNGFAFWYKLLDAGTYSIPISKNGASCLISLTELNHILTEIKQIKINNSSKIKRILVD